MSDVYDPNQDEDENGAEGAPGEGAAPPGGSGESSTISAGGAPGTNPAASQGPKAGSGRFLNIQKYIQANQGADYAGRIGQDIRGQAEQFKSKLGEAKSGIESQVNPELQRLQGAQSTIQGALDNPVAAAANADQVSSFNKLRTGDYLKNIDIANKGNLLQQQDQLNQSAQMAGTEPGRFQLLRQTFAGNPNYTPGATKLDQLLLQSKSGQLKQLIPQAQAAAKEGSAALSGLQGDVAGYQQQLGQLGSAAQQQAQEGITGLIGSSKEGLEARRAQEQSARQGEFQRAQQAIQSLANSGRISADMAQKLGLQAGQNLYGIDQGTLAQYAQQGALDVGLQNVTTADDVAKFKALQSLSGVEGLGDFSSVGPQLGQAVNYSPEGLQSALSQRQGAYQQDFSAGGQQSAQTWLDSFAGKGQSASYLPQAQQGLEKINSLQRAYGQPEYEIQQGLNASGRPWIKYVPKGSGRVVQYE